MIARWLATFYEKLLSPTQVEFFLIQKEKHIIDYLSEKLNLFFIIVLAFVVGGTLINFSEAFSPYMDYRSNGGFGIVRLIRFVVGWMIVLSPISLVLNRKFRKVGLFLITLIGWNIVTWRYFGFLENVWLTICILISLPTQLLISYFLLKKCELRDTRKRIIISYAVSFFLLDGIVSYLILTYSNERKLFVFWNLKSQFIFFSTIAAFYFSKNRKKFANIFLVPVNCLVGFIWPISTELCSNSRKEKSKLWVHGFFNIAIGYSAVGVRIIFENEVVNQATRNFLKYPGYYILAILGIIGHLNILSGVARLYGVQVTDATRFIFLARSPAEYWRRGVVYHYLFIRNFIFMSLYRRIKLTALCVGLAFAFFLVKKIGIVNYTLFISQFFGLSFISTEFDFAHRELWALIQWTFWFILLLASPYLFSKTELFENKAKAWGSILLTHLLMAGTYYATYLVQKISLDKRLFW